MAGIPKRQDLLISTWDLVDRPMRSIFLSNLQQKHQILWDLPSDREWDLAS